MNHSDSIRLAVGTLTVLPVGRVGTIDRRVSRAAMLLAPLAVAWLAVVAAGAGWLTARLGWPPLLCGLVCVGALTVGTRALHLDGLADTVDGLGSGRDRDSALAVMRRGDIGPMGVVALVLVLAAQSSAAGTLLGSWRGALELAALICCSRAALALGCRHGVPAARPDGLGATVAGAVPGWAAVLTWVVVGGVLVSLRVWSGEPAWLGVLSVAVAALLVVALVRHCERRLGGVTGDVMGAAVEVAFTALVLSAVR